MFLKMKQYITENTGILIRIDDIAENMNWEAMKKAENLFDKYSIKPVLGVIPNNKDDEFLSFPKKDNFWDQVRFWEKKGWEIAMHGYTHIYDHLCKKSDDYFNYGGGSEFFGHPLEIQTSTIKNGLKKFKDENIKIRTFFAPNQTYDKNTFIALKNCGIKEVIDGYGLMPYTEHEIKFIPQLFAKVILLPFGIQSTKLHLNLWTDDDFSNFENFLKKNSNKIITYDEAIKKINDNLIFKSINILSKQALKLKRIRLKRDSDWKIKQT